MPAKWKILPEKKAKRIYRSKDYWATLSDTHRRIVYTSICFWDIEWLALNITRRWTTSKKLGRRYPIPKLHKKLWRITIEGGDVVIVVPRGFAKTTAVCKILALWLLLFEIEPSILLISSKSLGEVIIADIRRELEENKLIKFIWGQLIPIDEKKDKKTEVWRQSYLQLLNGTEIKTMTKGQSIRGQRPTLILIDDPEDNRDVKNPRITIEFFTWVFTSLYNALDEGGRMIVLGTIISSNCFINRLKADAGRRSFKVFEYPAILNFNKDKIRKGTKNGEIYYFFDEGIGEPLWPLKWSIKKLEIKYNKIGHDPFMQEYMHVPLIVNGSPVFSKNYTYKIMQPIDEIDEFKIYRPLMVPDLDQAGNQLFNQDGTLKFKKQYGFLGLDFADGGVDGDYSVVNIRNSKFELMASYRGHIAQDVLVEKVDKFLAQFKDVFMVPENNHGLVFINNAKQKDWFFKMYTKEVLDQVTFKPSQVIGFNTNKKTKPFIINEMDQMLRMGNWEVYAELKDEIEHYYHNEKGGMEAIDPWHDDTVIADALCIQAVKHGILAPLFS